MAIKSASISSPRGDSTSSSPPPTTELKDASSYDDSDDKPLSETKPGWQVFLLTLGIIMSLFLVALDRTIVSTVSRPCQYDSLCDSANLARPFHKSQTSSTLCMTLDGMEAPTFCPPAHSSCFLGNSSPFSPSSTRCS